MSLGAIKEVLAWCSLDEWWLLAEVPLAVGGGYWFGGNINVGSKLPDLNSVAWASSIECVVYVRMHKGSFLDDLYAFYMLMSSNMT
jgi:hypothetical protein